MLGIYSYGFEQYEEHISLPRNEYAYKYVGLYKLVCTPICIL